MSVENRNSRFYLQVLERKGAQAARKATMTSSTATKTQEEIFQDYQNKAQEVMRSTSPYPRNKYKGRGIVMCAGGQTYFTCAYVAVRRLRELGCKLPVEFWYLGPYEMNKEMVELVRPLGVTCIDAYQKRKEHPCRILNGWELNPYSIIHSRFEEVLFLDADNFPLVNPEFLFDTPQYKETGAIFWPDYLRLAPDRSIWKICRVEYRDEEEFESGQIVVNKARRWKELALTMHLNEHSDFYYRHVWGDKETYHMAWRMYDSKYSMVPFPIQQLPVTGNSLTMCQHDFDGRRIFQHRNLDKWRYDGVNIKIPGFLYESDGLQYVKELRSKWDGIVFKGIPDEEPSAVALRARINKYKHFWYVVDGRSRILEFRPDGTIGAGASHFENSWRVEHNGEKLCITILAHPRISARLYQKPGSDLWVGYQLETGRTVAMKDRK